MDELTCKLWQLQDPAYREMQIRIIPTISAEQIIGVRTPQLRVIASLLQDKSAFISDVPHSFFEENQIHAFILSSGKDFETVAAQVDCFLPFIDNWATCDQLSPRIFRKHRTELLPFIEKWIRSGNPYSIRFAVKMLMDHFLDEDFDDQFPEIVASITNEEYYVRMMIAWYFATALAKQYQKIYPYLAGYRLEKWVHNKTIQKAVESYRVTPEHKEQLRLLRMK